MKRDMDLIRDLLLGIEQDERLDGTIFIAPDESDNLGVIGITNHSAEEVAYHLMMLMEAGLIKGNSTMEQMPAVSRLTWEGHEFLDNIKDQSIWGKTKERLKGLPGVGIAVIGEVAKAELKKHLGLP